MYSSPPFLAVCRWGAFSTNVAARGETPSPGVVRVTKFLSCSGSSYRHLVGVIVSIYEGNCHCAGSAATGAVVYENTGDPASVLYACGDPASS